MFCVENCFHSGENGVKDDAFRPNACRAYFHLKEAAGEGEAGTKAVIRDFLMNFDGGHATAIDAVTPDLQHSGNEVWYSIYGRRVNGMPTTRGVYVVNGKKVVIK